MLENHGKAYLRAKALNDCALCGTAEAVPHVERSFYTENCNCETALKRYLGVKLASARGYG
jgi:hypothetical protein